VVAAADVIRAGILRLRLVQVRNQESVNIEKPLFGSGF